MTSIELQIQDLLNQNSDPLQVGRELGSRLQQNTYGIPEQIHIAQFLLKSGSHLELLDLFERLLDDNLPIPWAQLVELLKLLGIKPNETEKKALIEGVREQGAVDEVLRTRAVDDISRYFVKARAKKDAEDESLRQVNQQSMREQINFYRTQRLIEEESELLKKYSAMYPRDPSIKEDQKSYEERWARHIVSEKVEKLAQQTKEEPKVQLTTEQKSIRDLLKKRAIDFGKQDPKKIYDLAVTMTFMEFYKEALEILRLAPRTKEGDWLELDLLLKSRNYLEALDFINHLEIKYAQDPESSFSVIYSRALAIWGLGQLSTAIELLRSIVKIRPHYKNAASLLNSWTGGDS